MSLRKLKIHTRFEKKVNKVTNNVSKPFFFLFVILIYGTRFVSEYSLCDSVLWSPVFAILLRRGGRGARDTKEAAKEAVQLVDQDKLSRVVTYMSTSSFPPFRI